MKRKLKLSEMAIDEELLNVFQELYADDPEGYKAVVNDTKKAFAFIRRIELRRNPNYDFNNNF